MQKIKNNLTYILEAAKVSNAEQNPSLMNSNRMEKLMKNEPVGPPMSRDFDWTSLEE